MRRQGILVSLFHLLIQLCRHHGAYSFSLTSRELVSFIPSRRYPVSRPSVGLKFMQGATADNSCLISSVNTRRSLASNPDIAEDFVEAESLFTKHCDSDGLMTKGALLKLQFVSELLAGGDLEKEELDDIWNAAAKFPLGKSEERIDVDSFVQIYRDVDDLFEYEDEDDDNVGDKEKTSATTVPAKQKQTPSAQKEADKVAVDESMADELETIFKSICDKDGFLSNDDLQQWDELQKLFDDGLLGDEEYESLWLKAAKRAGSKDKIDLDEFLSFNVDLDGLFEFDDTEEAVDGTNTKKAHVELVSSEVIDDYDLTPEVLFAALADSKGQVGMEELKRWGELQEFLEEGDLLPLELENIFDGISKASMKPDKVDQAGFLALYEEINSMFEDDDEESEESEEVDSKDAESRPPANSRKAELLQAAESLNRDEERLPCGLESTDREQQLMLDIVSALESEPANIIRQKQGAVEMADLVGEWDLLYSSSAAMRFNKGLSGIGGSFPNGRFGGLRQTLKASKYMTDVEYIEHIAVQPDTASFDVKVTGNWELRTSVSIFTGDPSIVLTIVPEKVAYGPTSTRADHWKSLGPTNMLDVTYLDETLRVMRGNTATDSIFIYRKAN